MSFVTAKLKDISIIQTGKLDANAAVENGSYPFFTCDPVTLHIDKWAYDTEAVLLAGNNASGNYTAKYYNGKFNAYQRTYIIESVNTTILNTRFLCYSLNQQLRLLKTMSSGSTTKFLTIRMLHTLDIPLPNIDLQNRIVEIVSAYDDLIENNQKQIKLLEEAAQRLYKEWFIDLHFPGHENTPIHDGLPEGWEKVTIADVCETVGGGTPSTSHNEYYENGTIRWVTPTDLTKKHSLILLDTEKRITQEGLKNSSAKLLPPETILMTSRASIGYFAVCEHEVCTNQGFISCIPKQEEMRYYLLFNLMNRVDEIKGKATGSTFLEIAKRTFRELSIAIPSNILLTTFHEIVIPMISKIRVIEKEIVQLLDARDRLLPQLMSGELKL